MKAAAILLRWYKSFNINYLAYDDRQPGVVARPWNSISSPNDTAYRFIEIPLRSDITTIVGANESGKSHLLSGISKVLSGVGIPEADGTTPRFNVTDLCHYASIRDKNAANWPNVGVVFSGVTPEEWNNLSTAADVKEPLAPLGEVALVLAHSPKDNHEAILYFGRVRPGVPLNETQLERVRKHLPRVEFIKSDTPLASELPIDDLLAAASGGRQFASFSVAQAAAEFVSTLEVPAADNKKAQESVAVALHEIKMQIAKDRERVTTPTTLESKLFHDVIGVTKPTLQLLAETKREDRGFADGLVSIWNRELDKRLNLRRFWQQDDHFSLSINYKGGWFYFEIRDKTGAVYTFRERSSGLRYFLSYYIQAKSIETRFRKDGCIILMDEPDSFLSIAGQKNFLAVIESLVAPSQGNTNLQLIYTTHSPFLINPNYPHRVRLVRKGDAEEGSQVVHESRLRRYEPVRSALGIDCAQTLFMGEANILLEGPTDQYLLVELVRLVAEHRKEAPVIDLTSTVVMSAESAPSVAKVLEASQWGDEKIPATVVLFDSDEEGRKQLARVTGRGGIRKLIEPDFVVLIDAAISVSDKQKVVTTEDLIPSRIFAKAVVSYIQAWYPEEWTKNESDLQAVLSDASFGEQGNVVSAQAVFSKMVFQATPNREYDKMGVLQEVVLHLYEEVAKDPVIHEMTEIERRLHDLLVCLRRKVEQSRQASARESARQGVVRLSKDFFNRFKLESQAFEIELHLDRLAREVESIGPDGAPLTNVISKLLKEIRTIRSAGEVAVSGDAWNRWSSLLYAIRENPLGPEVRLDGERVEPMHHWTPDVTQPSPSPSLSTPVMPKGV